MKLIACRLMLYICSAQQEFCVRAPSVSVLFQIRVLKPGAFPWAAGTTCTLLCAGGGFGLYYAESFIFFYKAINTLLEEFLLYSARLCVQHKQPRPI
jgi:hypothetical protein